MTSYTLAAFTINLAYLAVALLTIDLFLRWKNWTAGVRFSEHVKPKILESSLGAGIYYGAWVIGACSVAAALLH